MEDTVEEELLALESIFYDSYSKIGDGKFRLRIDPSGEEGDDASLPPPLYIDIELPRGYPEKLPEFDLSNLNNSNYPDPVKKAILKGLLEQASGQLGENMCYSLMEWLKDKLPEFYAMKPVAAQEMDQEKDAQDQKSSSGQIKKDTKLKSDLTKAQKRRFYDKFGASAEKPRGWNWVQIISHLSQVPQHSVSAP